MASMSMLMSTVGPSSSWSACAGVVAMRTASSAAAIVRVYLCEVILDCGKRREVFFSGDRGCGFSCRLRFRAG